MFRSCLPCWELARLLQQFVLFQSERYAHRHLCDEPLAGHLGHLLAEAEVDLTDASAALEKVQGMVCDPITNYRETERNNNQSQA